MGEDDGAEFSEDDDKKWKSILVRIDAVNGPGDQGEPDRIGVVHQIDVLHKGHRRAAVRQDQADDLHLVAFVAGVAFGLDSHTAACSPSSSHQITG